MFKIAIMWPQLGPYHIARLTRAQTVLHSQGVRIVAIETARTDARNYWETVDAPCAFERHTLFAQNDCMNLTGGIIRRRLREVLDEVRPDCIAVNGWAPVESRIAIAWARRSRKTVVLMSDSNESDYGRTQWKEMIKRRIVSLCDAAFVAAEPQADYVNRLGMPPGRTFMGYDVVENDYFASGADQVRREQDEIRQRLGLERPFILSIVRFVPQKNIRRAMSAYASYVRQCGDASFDWVLCGDGPMKDVILEFRRECSLEDHIKLPGFVQYDQLPLYYGLAGAFWQASEKDTWALVVNEAMASGLPVLVSERCGCASTLVEPGVNGWMFNPFSVDAMTDVLLRFHRLSEGERAAMGRKSRETIARWGLDRFADGLWTAAKAANELSHRRKRGLSCIDSLLLRT